MDEVRAYKTGVPRFYDVAPEWEAQLRVVRARQKRQRAREAREAAVGKLVGYGLSHEVWRALIVRAERRCVAAEAATTAARERGDVRGERRALNRARIARYSWCICADTMLSMQQRRIVVTRSPLDVPVTMGVAVRSVRSVRWGQLIVGVGPEQREKT